MLKRTMASHAIRTTTRTVVVASIAALALATPLEAQRPSGFGGASDQARNQAYESAFKSRDPRDLTPKRTLFGGAALTDAPLASVEFEGNTTIPDHAIERLIGTQAGRPAYEAQVSADVRTLYEKRWFRKVTPLIKSGAAGPVLVFQVEEHPVVGNVEFRGNNDSPLNVGLSDKKLLAECGLVPFRSPYDPFANKKCVERIKKLYRDKGYREAEVTLLSGSKPNERDVIFQINRGDKIVVDYAKFVGNESISSAVLKTKLVTKRRWFWAIGGVFDPLTLADDEAALKQYYQNLGYFDAQVTASALRPQDSGSLTVQYTIDEGPLYSVDQIRFEGNTIFADGDLRANLELKEGDRFLARNLRKDLQALKDKYDERARPFAQVQFEREFSATPGKVNLVYRFDEDIPRVIGRININIRGDDPHTSEQVVLNQISRSLTPGMPARAKDIKLATDRLRGNQIWERTDPATVNVRPVEGLNYLSPSVARGQDVGDMMATSSGLPVFAADASVPTGHSMLRPTTPVRATRPQGDVLTRGVADPLLEEIEADLKQSTEGFYEWLRQPEPPEFKPLHGSAPVEEPTTDDVVVGRSVIRGQSADGVDGPGTFRSQSIDQFGQPIPQSFFGGGSPQGDPFGGTLSGQPPGFVDIDIDVTEARTGRFMFGAGVNSDAGVVGQIVLEENNFDLFRPPRSFADFRNGRAWRGGGQSFRIEAAPGAEVSRYLVNWSDPFFMNTDYSLGVAGFFYTRFFQDWTEERLGGRVTVGRTLNQFWSVSTAIRMEDVTVSGVTNIAGNEAPQDLADTIGSNFLSTGRFNVAYDSRDSGFIPTRGLLTEFGFEQAFGEYNYSRFDINASQYWTVYERPDGYGKHTLRLSGRVGFLTDGAPVFERYFAGGFQSLRGWEFRGVSPETQGSATATPRRTGGDFQFVNTLEYMFPLTATDNFKGVLFSDFGTVSEDVSLDEFRASAGFGFRVNVPAMGPAPLAFDFAFPLVDEQIDDRRVFSFYIGLTR